MPDEADEERDENERDDRARIGRKIRKDFTHGEPLDRCEDQRIHTSPPEIDVDTFPTDCRKR